MYKFTIDKRYTTVASVPHVKQIQKELKAIFTEGDILAMFNDATGHCVSGSILETKVEGFDVGSWSEDVSFSITMFVYDEYSTFYHVSFYMDYTAETESFAVTTRNMDVLVNVRKYTRDF